MSDLKKCPFCGGEAEMDTEQAYRNITTGQVETAIAVYCLGCGAHQGICRGDVPDVQPAEVIELWNTRAEAKLRESAEPVAWMWEEVVDPTGDVIVGKTVTHFATHWSTPPSYAEVTPLFTHPTEQTDARSGVREALRAASRALLPFYNAVFNDNGDITVNGPYDYEEAVAGYFAYRKVEAVLSALSPAAPEGREVVDQCNDWPSCACGRGGPDHCSHRPTVTEAMVRAFQEKYREFWKGSWPDSETSRELIEATLAQEGK